MAKKVRIGFVGAGSMGQCAHLKNYVAIPDCEVVALAELRGDVREKVTALALDRNPTVTTIPEDVA